MTNIYELIKKNLITLNIVLICMILSGCKTVKIESNKAEWYNNKLTKVYILFNSAEVFQAFSNDLGDDLVFFFNTQGVETKYRVKLPLSLETDEEIKNEIKDFGPAQLIVFTQSLTRNHAGGMFEISITETENGKIVWKGIIDIYGNVRHPGIKRILEEKSLSALINQLKIDELL